PAAAAWVAAGRPAVDAPPPVDGRCGRCGEDGPTLTSARIISEKFTGFDAWPFGSRRLCVPCAWAYSRQPTSQPSLLITDTTVTEYSSGAALADMLTVGRVCPARRPWSCQPPAADTSCQLPSGATSLPTASSCPGTPLRQPDLRIWSGCAKSSE